MARKRFSRVMATFFLWLAFKCDKPYINSFLRDPSLLPPIPPLKGVTEDESASS